MGIVVRTLLLCLITLCLIAGVNAATFNINSTADTNDAVPAAGICADLGGTGSFRAAITETSALNDSLSGGPFSVSGRILMYEGVPIGNVAVILNGGGLTEPRVTFSSSLGHYIFTNVPANSYTISISSKRYVFVPDAKLANVASDITDIDFSGSPDGQIFPARKILQWPALLKIEMLRQFCL